MADPKRIWITGASRSGKTTRLIRVFCDWVRSLTSESPSVTPQISATPPTLLPGVLVLAAIGDNRIDLVDRLTTATQGKYAVTSTTPLGFVQDEVTLFYPLLVQQLGLTAQFPIRLSPENELELATQLWRPELDVLISQHSAVNVARLVRRVLDLLQLAALAGIPIADIPTILQQGLGEHNQELPLPADQVADWLQQWQTWCLARGLVSYGLMASLYWQWLLPHPTYQQHLAQRYQFLLADDVDEYPAIARDLFEVLMQQGIAAAFTFNPDGAVRLGLGADPTYLAALAEQCETVELSDRPVPSLATEWSEAIVEFVTNPLAFTRPPAAMQTIQTSSRAELLRQTAAMIVAAVQAQQIQPRDIAVIGPGLDAIARYALIEMLTKQGIPVASLHDQRPLNSFPVVRALLTLLALVYPNLGRLVDREAIAEMLVVLSQQAAGRTDAHSGTEAPGSTPPTLPRASATLTAAGALIDPVRAGLLADYCFAPHPDRPRLLPATTFPRWDRLGYQASDAYQQMVQWIEQQQEQLAQRLMPNPVALCDRAIQQFLLSAGSLPYHQLAAIRQFIETAQHYWEVNQRLQQSQRGDFPAGLVVSRFIQLLRTGAIAANPYPVRPIGPESNAVTLATVFQYRSNRGAHRWQFWLDAASPRWLSGVDALFASPLFLHDWSGHFWTGADALEANEQRLRRILLDLLARAEERVYLCHSELATNGQEQTGILLPLVHATSSV
ncbi:MAG: recombinase family protein [Leptolyngbyaceae cyanobacterium bins.349]|nr:recombinase family protein [Leptolyngbyaceae cyanobacterium bins.349]